MNNKLFYVNILESEQICVESISVSGCGKFLALSYGNNIALYDFKTSQLLAKLSEKNEDYSFRSLLWIPRSRLENIELSEYRFISVGLHGIVTEWDLVTFKPKVECFCFGGAIFSGVLGPNCDLYLGCDDGILRLFSLYSASRTNPAPNCSLDLRVEEEEIEFKKNLLKHNAPILSAFCGQKRFFCGTSNSQILVCEYGRSDYKTLRLKTGAYFKSKRGTEGEAMPQDKDVNVWSLLCVNNELISGDSAGNVVVWDLETLTASQVLTQHTNDVISLAPIDNHTFVSAGLDSRLVLYSCYKSGNSDYSANLHSLESMEQAQSSPGSKWTVRGFKYPLKGDIRALTTTGGNVPPSYSFNREGGNMGNGYHFGHGPSGGDSWVLCGGSWGCVSLSKTPQLLKNKRTRLIYPNLDTFNTVKMSHRRDRVLVQYLKRVDLWHLSLDSSSPLLDTSDTSSSDNSSNRTYKEAKHLTKNTAGNDGALSGPEGEDEMKEICKICSINLRSVVRASAISPDGSLIAVLTHSSLKVYRLVNLQVEPLPFPHGHLNVLNIAFIANDRLLIHYHSSGTSARDADDPALPKRLGYGLALYHLGDSRLDFLDHAELSKYVYKMLVFPNEPEKGQGEELNENKGRNKGGKGRDEVTGNGVGSTESRALAALLSTDGAAHLLEFPTSSWFKLPQPPNSRISAVSANAALTRLLVVTNAFHYYCYNVEAREFENLKNLVSEAVRSGDTLVKPASKNMDTSSHSKNKKQALGNNHTGTTNNGSTDTTVNPKSGPFFTDEGDLVKKIDANGIVSNLYWVHDVAIVQTINTLFYFKPFGGDLSQPTTPTNSNGKDEDEEEDERGERKRPKVWIGPRRLSNIPSINSQSQEETPTSTGRVSDPEVAESKRARASYLIKNKFIVHSNYVLARNANGAAGKSGQRRGKGAIDIVVFKKRVNLDITHRFKKYGQ